jgi:hypothetical protein
MVDLMEADRDAAQGAGHCRSVLARTCDRITTPHAHRLADT